ncbi:MAG: molecular chaperone DnaJ [Acidiphilium sp.]|jgi:molecular chaperone DnaJ|uniref:Chaperone protein DnaJ n=2 Tax=Acidiphilium acidophilum TaxID=76588 RepID=A0AAW9DQQ1_ACIAO|nr:molecular chaperone DnaJ [Acidiphilium acidophilum]MDD2861981.1 molecular chaperone DnaJ [Acidiphilium sp.]MDX5930889.1 molecular chaperone DnaJ [Acidiphilium acidophilum]MEE3501615.1 molecular chaperone DnaJ [Acidiphilium acidophilum]
MAKTDYYELLGARRGASADELKKAYRKMAMQYHPDRNPGDKAAEQRFKDVNEAYDVLKDDQKRAAYDKFGHAAFENGGGPGGFGGGGFGFEGGIGDIFEQMFGEAMGGRRGGGRAERTGADVRAAVEIDLTQAFAGTKVEVRVPTRVACDACNGTGSADKQASSDNCPTCGGAGRVRAQQGFFVVERTCPTCGGAGRTIRNPCRVCAGAGTLPRERTLSVAIPAGVEDGTRIRLSGEGEAGGKGAPPGDLYVHVAIRPHAIFQRDGANVFCRVPLRMSQAALGGEIEVPAIDGSRARVKIPTGTQTGDQFRLRGKGFSVLRSTQRGDMYIQVAVETPQNLTRRQRELLEEFEREAGGSTSGSPEHEGFFAKVKEFFEGL